jgi:MFS family permease
MLEILRRPIYAKVFAAQVIALLGTGLLTVALGLLAYDLAGERAGVVLGTALAIKMIAYVALAPLAAAVVGRLPRQGVLVAMDALRAAAALMLPFVDAVWQIYVMIFLLQAASATFTPTFQALIPDLLPDEADYTRALSLARLAYDLENLISPALAGLLLLVMSYHGLFAGTAAGFALSALLVAAATLPPAARDARRRPFVDRLTRGVRIYLATPRLRGLLALNLAASAAGAMVIVNTVVIVRTTYGGSESEVALALGAFGLGSMIAALALPGLLDRVRERTVMSRAALAMTLLLMAPGVLWWAGVQIPWLSLLIVWLILGLLYSMVLTPSGRLLRRSAHAEDRPAVFAAQFALSHAGWLITYPLAGTVGHAASMGAAMILLGGLGLLGVIAAALVWPAGDPDSIEHVHADLPADHPHLHDAVRKGGVFRHRHLLVIDDEHRAWPTQG